MKVEEHQKKVPKVKMGDNELKNLYSAVCLGAEVPSDGDKIITLKHFSDIAGARFNEYRKAFTSTKLLISLRVCLHIVLVEQTQIYCVAFGRRSKGQCEWYQFQDGLINNQDVDP